MVWWFRVVSEYQAPFCAEINATTLSNAFERVKLFYPGALVFAINEKDAKFLQKAPRRAKMT
jgi:hypothetical protein